MGRSKANDSGVYGCCVVDKPPGCTSHDVVDMARKAFGTRKVGHAGTLDPDATGVLVLGVGKGTKLLQFVTGADKKYTGEVVLGIETSTLDSAGEVVAEFDMTVTADEVAEAAKELTGDIEQIPPMVSAIKIDGKRLHELAREGIEVERKARPVTVYSYETRPTKDPLVYEVDVHCSSGTYIRSLASDLGRILGGGGHLRNLRRLSVGGFTLDGACPVEDLRLSPLNGLVSGMPTITVDSEVAAQVKNGRPLGPSSGEGRLAVADEQGNLLAVYEVIDGLMKPAKVLP